MAGRGAGAVGGFPFSPTLTPGKLAPTVGVLRPGVAAWPSLGRTSGAPGATVAKKKTSTAKPSGAPKPKAGGAAAGKGTPRKKPTSKKTKKTAGKAAGAASKGAKKTTGKAAGTASRKAATGAPAKKSTGKSSSRAASKKSTSKKAGPKKTAKKAGSKAAKTGKKATSKKTPTKKTTTNKTTTKKTGAKKAPAKGTPTKAPPKKTDGKKAEAGKASSPPAPPPPPASGSGANGADNKPSRPSRPKRPKPPAAVMPEGIGGLLSPGGPARRPLIASSQRVAPADAAEAEKYPTKSPFNKRELQKFREILLRKRNEVLSEVTGLEGGALTSGGSGNLSHTPQHMADAGSDAADQTLSLDLAAAERNLIREIDAALKRIADGVFGLCEATGKPIRKERLQELPWARYSIDAARQFEGKR